MSFDAGAVVGKMRLDLAGWSASVRDVIADTGNVRQRTAGMEDAARRAAAAITALGRSMTSGVAGSSAGLVNAKAALEGIQKSALGAATNLRMMQGRSMEMAAAWSNAVKAGETFRVAQMRQAAMLGLGGGAAAGPGRSTAGAALALDAAAFTRSATSIVNDSARINAALLGIASQAAYVVPAMAGVGSALQAASMAASGGFITAIARMIVLRQEARKTAAAIQTTAEVASLRRAAMLGLGGGLGTLSAEESAMAAQATAVSAMAARITTLGGAALGALAAVVAMTAATVALGRAAADALRESIAFEQGFVGVRKTVDASAEEFEALSSGIRAMSRDMPVTTDVLNQIAEAAGALGIETPNIEKFVRVVAGMSVATNLTADAAATAFAQWANITQLPQKNIDRLASTIVDLGNKTAATERDIVAMGLRVAGAGHVVGLTDAQIAGVSATLSSLGLEAEAAGTAMSTFMYEMAAAADTGGKKLEVFAALAGKSARDFAEEVKTRPLEAIVDVISGLERLRQAGGNFTEVLEALGLSERRMRDAMSRLSSNSQFLANVTDLGTRAFERNAAMQAEVDRAFGTTASQIQILKNRFTDLKVSIGNELLPALQGAIAVLKGLTDVIGGAGEKAAEAEASFGSIARWFASGILKGAVLDLLGPLGQLWSILDAIGQAQQWINRSADAAKEAARSASDLQDAMRQGAKVVGGDIFRIVPPAVPPMTDLKKKIEDLGKVGDLTEKAAAKLNLALPLESIRDRVNEIIALTEKFDTVVKPDAVRKNFQDLWAENRDELVRYGQDAGTVIDRVGKGLADVPPKYRAVFLEAARAFEADKLQEEAAKKAAEAGKRAQEEAKRLAEQAQQMRESALPKAGILADLKQLQEQSRQFPQIFDAEAIEARVAQIWEQNKDKAVGSFEDLATYLRGAGIGEKLIVWLGLDRYKTQLEEVTKTEKKALDDIAQGADGGIRSLLQSAQSIGDRIGGPEQILKTARDAIAFEQFAGTQLTDAMRRGLALEDWSRLGDAIRNRTVDLDALLAKLAQIDPVMAKAVRSQASLENLDRLAQGTGQLANAFQSLGREMQNSLVYRVGAVVQAISATVTAYRAVRAAAEAAAMASKIAWFEILGPIALVIEAIEAAATAFGLFGGETKKEKVGIERAWEEIGKSVEGWIDRMTDAFVEFVKTGKMNWKDLVDSMLSDIIKITLKYAVMQPLLGGLGIKFAHGGVLDRGNIVPFARGGLVSRPTLFPMASGLGLMGEAGPEAVVPLKRLRNGDLGIEASGPLGAEAPIIQIVDARHASTAPVEVSDTTVDGRKAIRVLVRDSVKETIASGELDRLLCQTYNLSRRGQRKAG